MSRFRLEKLTLAQMLLLTMLLFAAGCHAPAATTDIPPATVQAVVLNDITVLPMDDSPHTFQAFEFPNLDQYPDRSAMMPGGKFQAVIRTYLVQTAGRTVLVDGGMGKELGVTGRTTEILAANGVRPEDVTDILLTHMDIDHVGGLVQNGQAVFPRATLRVSRIEHEAWMAGNVKRPADQIAVGQSVARAYAGRIKLFDFGATVLPGIVSVDARGHTPGHTAFDVTSGDKGLTIVGDLLHVHPIQLKYTDYCSIYDDAPELAAGSRARILASLSEGDRQIAAMHFPMIGKVRTMAGGGYQVVVE